jgi:DNA-binding transcriptional LysR family regulator
VVPEDHALADGPVTVDALRDEVVVGSLGTPGLNELADRCRLNGFVCTDYLTVRALVAAGQGIAVLPRMAAAHALPGTVVRHFEDRGPRRSVSLARAADGVASPAAAAMADVIIAHASSK